MRRMEKEPASSATKHGVYGSVSFLALIASIAISCEIACQYGWDEALMGLRDDITVERGRFQTRRLRQDESDSLLEHDHQEKNSKTDQSPYACGEIFLYVRDDEQVSPNATTSSNISAHDSTICDMTYSERLCSYARSCDGSWPSQIFLPLILCHGVEMHFHFASGCGLFNNTQSSNVPVTNKSTQLFHEKLEFLFIYFILPPTLLIYLFLLFRMLATTADNYFSPALETFSFELGLPPRFAGATLLALGNGSPDLGATVNAILLWNKADETARMDCLASGSDCGIVGGGGWSMSLGSLTGGGMFVGTIVCGLVVLNCGGITCRGSLLRDISMYAISVYIVRGVLESGEVTRKDVLLFLEMYIIYVAVIFCSDMYHKKVTRQRIKAESQLRKSLVKEKRASRLLSDKSKDVFGSHAATEASPLMGDHTCYVDTLQLNSSDESPDDRNTENDGTLTDAPSLETSDSNPPKPRLSVTDRFAMMMSNYDAASFRIDSSIRSTDSDPETRAIRPVVHSVRVSSYSHMDTTELEKGLATLEEDKEYKGSRTSLVFPEESSIVATRGPGWSVDLFCDAFNELCFQSRVFWKDRVVQETSLIEKFATILELPFTALRSATVPVPCEDHWIRPLVSLSTATSSFWVLWYLDKSFTTMLAAGYCAVSISLALCILRYTEDDKMPLVASVPLSLYGFFIAATWIDVIGKLVSMLEFLGTLTRIPSPILGMTVLAWGNSMGDLSANIAMAKKGMPDMATTGKYISCFNFANTSICLSVLSKIITSSGCFAGPSFNLLVGTGLGFLSLQRKLDMSYISPVTLTPSIRIGFLFILINCSSAIICGMFCKWEIPHRYSYVFFAMYAVYIFVCVKAVFLT
mmetsp:Transcript_19503/g.40855  ORF Transcript_19503/g.40855 Transcript_19503/m.40855 type:complete len:865 (-) Transcript_19503:130-2724(-)